MRLFLFLLLFCLSCNSKSKRNSFSLIINIDSLEFYKHPLESKNDLKSFSLSNFNAKDFILKYDIKKDDTILVKMIEAADCISFGVNIQRLLKTENLNNVFLKKFDDTEDAILGYRNFILFDTAKKILLSVPRNE